MSLLVCAATRFELETFRRNSEVWEETGEIVYRTDDFACAVSGVGIPETFVRLSAAVQILKPHRILNTGIAGAYPDCGLAIGDIVLGTTECYGDIGFELPEGSNSAGFQPIADSSFGAFYAEKLPIAPLGRLPEWTADYSVRIGAGCTVNACTGTLQTGRTRARLFQADFETMEGAAVAQIGVLKHCAVYEIRAISNIAAERDMRPENIRLALANLRHFLQACREQNTF